MKIDSFSAHVHEDDFGRGYALSLIAVVGGRSFTLTFDRDTMMARSLDETVPSVLFRANKSILPVETAIEMFSEIVRALTAFQSERASLSPLPEEFVLGFTDGN